MRLTEQAHLIVRNALRPGDWAVDATAGNGYDTLFLAHCVGASGRVFAFDVQAAAIAATAARLAGIAQVELFQHGHERLLDHLPAQALGRCGAIMFNLGYLPGTDKSIITTAATTLPALDQASRLLRPGGVLSVMVYAGHAGGEAEATAVYTWSAALCGAFTVTHDRRGDGQDGPTLIAIQLQV